MRKLRLVESPEARDERPKVEARRKTDMAEAEAATVDRLVRESIRLYGP